MTEEFCRIVRAGEPGLQAMLVEMAGYNPDIHDIIRLKRTEHGNPSMQDFA